MNSPTSPKNGHAPRNTDAEQALLGACLYDAEQYDLIRDRLEPGDFYDPAHQWVFEAMQECAAQGYGIDVLSVTQRLEERGQLPQIGGAVAVAHLLNQVPHIYHADHYASIIKQLAWRRRVLAFAGEIAKRAHSGEISIQDIHEYITEETARLGGGAMQSARTARQMASAFLDELLAARSSGQPRRGWHTGFSMADRLLGSGYGPGSYTVLGAYTNQGKTQFAAQMSLAAAQQGPTLYVTLESLPERIYDRQIAVLSGVSATRIIERDILDDESFEAAAKAADWYSKLPLEIQTLDTLAEIENYITDMSIRHNFAPGMVFLDDVDSLAEGMKGSNDYERQKRAAVGLLRLALRTGWGVVALKQFLMPTDVQGVNNYQLLYDKLKPTIMSFEGGRTISQKGGNVIGMLSAEWVCAKVNQNFHHDQLKPGYVYFTKLKARDARSDGVQEMALRFNPAVPRFEDVRLAEEVNLNA